MFQMVHLAIVSRDGLTITVVKAPLALRRDGASPVPLVRLYDTASLASVQWAEQTLVTKRFTASGGVAKLVNAAALDAAGGNALRVRGPPPPPTLL